MFSAWNATFSYGPVVILPLCEMFVFSPNQTALYMLWSLVKLFCLRRGLTVITLCEEQHISMGVWYGARKSLNTWSIHVLLIHELRDRGHSGLRYAGNTVHTQTLGGEGSDEQTLGYCLTPVGESHSLALGCTVAGMVGSGERGLGHGSNGCVSRTA